MENSISYFLSVISLYGGLIFWPVFRIWKGVAYKITKWLKWQFIIHIFLVGAGLYLVHYYKSIGNRDWWMAMMIPQGLGMLSFISAVLILLIGHILRSDAQR